MPENPENVKPTEFTPNELELVSGGMNFSTISGLTLSRKKPALRPNP
jgi:hypothetical protein